MTCVTFVISFLKSEVFWLALGSLGSIGVAFLALYPLLRQIKHRRLIFDHAVHVLVNPVGNFYIHNFFDEPILIKRIYQKRVAGSDIGIKEDETAKPLRIRLTNDLPYHDGKRTICLKDLFVDKKWEVVFDQIRPIAPNSNTTLETSLTHVGEHEKEAIWFVGTTIEYSTVNGSKNQKITVFHRFSKTLDPTLEWIQFELRAGAPSDEIILNDLGKEKSKKLIGSKRHLFGALLSIIGTFILFSPNHPRIHNLYDQTFFKPITEVMNALSNFNFEPSSNDLKQKVKTLNRGDAGFQCILKILREGNFNRLKDVSNQNIVKITNKRVYEYKENSGESLGLLNVIHVYDEKNGSKPYALITTENDLKLAVEIHKNRWINFIGTFLIVIGIAWPYVWQAGVFFKDNIAKGAG